VLNPESLASLEFWVQKTAIKLVQVNGQRKYGGPPPDWMGPAPGPGCEVFISQIPRDVYEDKLIPLFQRAGPLYEFRLMMNFSGQNRGFAYAKYANPQSAAAAISSLHRYKLQQGVQLAVRRSTEKRQLSLGDLPTGVDREWLLQTLRGLSEGVESVSLKFEKGGKKVTAIVHYASHYTASMAKKALCEAFKKKFGITISVKWFKTRQDEEDEGEVSPSPKSFPKLPPKPCSLPRCRPLDHDQLPPAENLLTLLSPCLSSVIGCSASSSQLDTLALPDARALLLRVCELFKVGPPLYDLQYLHTEPNGFLYFAYRVGIPGLPFPFTGMAQILPGTSITMLREEVQQTAAKHVLKATGSGSCPYLLSSSHGPQLDYPILELLFSKNSNQRDPCVLTVLQLAQHQSCLPPYLCLLFHDGEDSLNAYADAHTWHLPAFGVEHAHQTVIASAPSHTAHTHTLLPYSPVLLCGRRWGGAGLGEHCLIDHTGVVVQTTSQAEVKHHLVGRQEGGQHREQTKGGISGVRYRERNRDRNRWGIYSDRLKDENLHLLSMRPLLLLESLGDCLSLEHKSMFSIVTSQLSLELQEFSDLLIDLQKKDTDR
ncbi:hypothetical protein JZ751_007012, partial [Albula glossodonta]